MVLVHKNLEESVSHVALNILFCALVLCCLFRIKRLCLVSLKVDLDAVKPVNTILIPRSLFLEDGTECIFEFLVFRPVLDELHSSKFREQKKDWEM
jgi:hypothetical protein